jgi:hypothetical protein
VCRTFIYTDVSDQKALVGGKAPGNLQSVNSAALVSCAITDIGAASPIPVSAPHGQVRFDAATDRKTWRQLEIVVRDGELRASFDGVALTPPPTLTAVQQALRRRLDWQAKKDPIRTGFLADLDATFDCRGAIGLYVYSSRAAFSDVVIEPLTPP